MELLIQEGANVNHQTRNGNTALMKSAINGHIVCVKHLLAKGASVDIKNIDQQTAKHLCEAARQKAEKRQISTEKRDKFQQKSIDSRNTEHKEKLTKERVDEVLEKFKSVLAEIDAAEKTKVDAGIKKDDALDQQDTLEELAQLREALRKKEDEALAQQDKLQEELAQLRKKNEDLAEALKQKNELLGECQGRLSS